MPKTADIRMVNDNEGTPVLEVIKEQNTLLICETSNMHHTHRNVKLALSAIPTLIDVLESLLNETAATFGPSIQELCGNDIPSRSVMLAQERVDV